MKRLLAVAGAVGVIGAVTAVTVVRCGGSHLNDPANAHAAAATQPPSPSPTVHQDQTPSASAGTASPDTSARASKGGGLFAPDGHSTPTPPTAASPAWFTVQLGATCIALGGTQTMTVQSRPGYSVSFNSQYVDGKRGDAYGGMAVVPTNASGWVQVRWTVARTAPLGAVTVGVGTGNGGSAVTTTVTFTLAANC